MIGLRDSQGAYTRPGRDDVLLVIVFGEIAAGVIQQEAHVIPCRVNLIFEVIDLGFSRAPYRYRTPGNEGYHVASVPHLEYQGMVMVVGTRERQIHALAEYVFIGCGDIGDPIHAFTIGTGCIDDESGGDRCRTSTKPVADFYSPQLVGPGELRAAEFGIVEGGGSF